MSTNQTVYVPKSNAKVKEVSFGTVVKVSFNAEALIKFAEEHKNEKGYLRLDIVPRKEVDDFGNTHNVKLDTWEPNKEEEKPASKKTSSTNKTPASKTVSVEDPDQECPF